MRLSIIRTLECVYQPTYFLNAFVNNTHFWNAVVLQNTFGKCALPFSDPVPTTQFRHISIMLLSVSRVSAAL